MKIAFVLVFRFVIDGNNRSLCIVVSSRSKVSVQFLKGAILWSGRTERRVGEQGPLSVLNSRRVKATTAGWRW